MIVDADVAPRIELERAIRRLFAKPEVAYLHVQDARPGCYACYVDRAE